MSISRRRFTSLGLATLAVSSALRVRCAEDAADELSFVDPELRPAARRLMANPMRPPTNGSGGPGRRPGADGSPPAFMPPGIDSSSYEKHTIKQLSGGPDVVVYVINAKSGTSRPAILHTHGGGYVGGSALGAIADCQKIALALDCTVATVEYRIAPATIWSGSLEDNYSALRWLHDNSEHLGIDRSRIALIGESAGGGHAALLALTARDRGEVPLTFQMLIYPMLDDRTGVVRTPGPPVGSIVWTPSMNRDGWRAFLGQEPGTAKVPTKAVPSRFASLAALPRTFIGVGSIDLFVDEDIEYARRLLDAGVPVELLVVPGAFHGFDVLAPDTKVAQQFSQHRIDVLRRALIAS